jgi:hypothetical protein
VKHKRAVLYELMRDHRGAGANGATGGRFRDVLPTSAEESDATASQIAPLHARRVPLGYVLLGIAALLVIGFAAYLMGHSRGRDNEALGSTDQGMMNRSDPGLAPDPPNSFGDASRTSSQSSASAGQPPRTPGPIESNPRTVGKNYFVLVQTSRTNAVRVAEFCRRNGLEAYVDRVNNADFRVFVLPGYTAEEMSSPAVAELERRIEDVKKAWNESVGRSDLGQHIAVKYRG